LKAAAENKPKVNVTKMDQAWDDVLTLILSSKGRSSKNNGSVCSLKLGDGSSHASRSQMTSLDDSESVMTSSTMLTSMKSVNTD